ncbi:MAG TPA: DsrE family protein [Thiobacillaceae bacterium]|nr:DsrE family protein [Thiobacillaceae bacterium]
MRITVLVLCLLIGAPVVSIPALADPLDGAASEKVIGVEKRKNIRVVYDDKDDVWDAGIGKGLYYLRGLLESYKSLKIDPKQLKISIVLHGDTAYWLLNDEAYRNYKNDPFTYNPNSKVVEELIEHGVSVEICRVTMRANGFQPQDLLPGVVMVHDAYTRLIDLQQRGYGYIRF